MTSKLVVAAGGVTVMLGVGGIAYMAGREAVEPRALRPSTSTTSLLAGKAAADDFVEVRHEQAGFAISYPKAWSRLESADREVVLVAAEKNVDVNQGGSILTRAIDLPAEVGADQLGEARQGTDAIVAKSPGVELKAQPTRLDLGGLPGYFYFYTFSDATTGERGAHSHYFLFKGKTMITIVFQALPDTDFVRLAPIFDQIATSFHVL